MLSIAPQVSMGQVYKCSGKGGTTYQDTPCKDAPKAAPYIAAATEVSIPPSQQPAEPADPSKPTPPPPTPSATATLRTLHAGVQAANAEQRRLEASYKQERETLVARMKHAPPEQAEVAVRQLNSKWVPMVQAASQRAQQMQEQIDQLCPGGATINAQEQTCNH